MIVLVAVAGLAASTQAALVSSETFTYPNGNLVGNGGWAAHSGAGSVPVQVSSGAIVLNQGTLTREDVNKAFAPPIGAGTIIYASFEFSNTGGNGNVYFAHFQQGTTNFRARTYITAATVVGDYSLGLSNDNTIPAVWGTALTFGTTYTVVTSYNFDTGESKLWVNPVSFASTSISAPGTASTAIAAFGFRQANPSVGTSSQTIDNLNVGTDFGDVVIPSPGALALIGLGGLFAGRRRR